MITVVCSDIVGLTQASDLGLVVHELSLNWIWAMTHTFSYTVTIHEALLSDTRVDVGPQAHYIARKHIHSKLSRSPPDACEYH